MRPLAVALTLALSLPVGLAAAPPAHAEAITLDASTRTAEAASPALKALEAALEAARARALAAGAWTNPSLVSQVQLSTNPDANMVTLGFRQPLDFRRLAQQRREAAEEEIASLALTQTRTRQQVRHQARTAYVSLWLAQATVAQHDRAVAYAEAELARGRKRVAAGALAGHELVHVEFELARARLDRQSAAHDAARARVRLNFLWGRPAEAPIAQPPAPATLPPLAPLSDWLAEGQAQRTELAQAVIAARREERVARLAESLRFGEGDIDLEAGTTGRGDPTIYGAFGLPVPLWNTREHEAAAARAESARHEAERAATAQHVAQEIADAYLEVQQASERHRMAASGLVPLAGHALEKAEARLRAGAARPAEVIEARQAVLAAESARLKALLDYHLAHARLALAAGR
jgi:cobalt-zinc-cadmium efflux system outer membrane protein